MNEGIQRWKINPSMTVVMYTLAACGEIGSTALPVGKSVYSYILGNQSVRHDVMLDTAILSMFVKCGDSGQALKVWNTMEGM